MDGLKLLKEATDNAKTWLNAYVEMMKELNESHLTALHPSYRERFWQTELDGLGGSVFGNHRPIVILKQMKIARINSLLLEQRREENAEFEKLNQSARC